MNRPAKRGDKADRQIGRTRRIVVDEQGPGRVRWSFSCSQFGARRVLHSIVLSQRALYINWVVQHIESVALYTRPSRALHGQQHGTATSNGGNDNDEGPKKSNERTLRKENRVVQPAEPFFSPLTQVAFSVQLTSPRRQRQAASPRKSRRCQPSSSLSRLNR